MMKSKNGSRLVFGSTMVVLGIALCRYLSKIRKRNERVVKHQDMKFEDLEIIRILGHNSFLCKFKGSEDGRKLILEIQSPSIQETDIKNFLKGTEVVKKFHENGIYKTYSVTPKPQSIFYKIHTIYPAPEFQIKKKEKQIFLRFVETIEHYKKYTKPFIDSLSKKHTKWIHDIFEGYKERNKVLFRNFPSNYRNRKKPEEADSNYYPHAYGPTAKFLLAHNEKYETGKTSKFHLDILAFAMDSSIRSVRDLKGINLELLEAIMTQGLKTMKDLFGIPAQECVPVVHYLPSFYHFHVHFVHISNTRTMKGCLYLTDIIQNLKKNPLYYQECDITFYLATQWHKTLINSFLCDN